MNHPADTVAAVATPAGAGGIGIVKVSGVAAFAVAETVTRCRSGEPLSALHGFEARLAKIVRADGTLIDEAVVLVYRGPKSYTGEDTVEIMCHGGEVVCEAVLRAVLDAGAVMASRGEFTRRAFVNGRISLTEAEAVCDLINAASRQGEAAAAALVDGALSRKLEALKAQVLALQAHLSAAIDFPEEDVDEIDGAALQTELNGLRTELRRLCDSFELGADLMRGVATSIVGSPNVGKSTLLNLLAGAPKALVTPVAGTTRDVVEQKVRLGGTVLLLADTAGIRESDDLVERMGIERALAKIDESSLVLAVFDASRPLNEDDRRLIERVREKRAVAVVNKTDLPPLLELAELEAAFDNLIQISANDESALGALDRAVARAIKAEHLDPDQPVLANERQRACAVRALNAVQQAEEAGAGMLDAVFASLTDCLAALADLSGENITESLLDEVFSRFCVGK